MEEVEWGDFKISDYFSVKRGTRLIENKRVKGTRPLVTAGFINSGISGYISNREQFEFSSGTITIDMFANTFYRDYKFSADDNILVLSNNNISREAKLFVSSVFNNSNEFNYGKQYRLGNYYRQRIMLPSKSDKTPDWDYMEQYIVNHMSEISVPELEPVGGSAINLNSVAWKEFAIEEIADVLSGVRLTTDKKIEGKIPFIGARDNGNGVESFVGNVNESTDQNFLGVNYNGNGVALGWYHPYRATISDDVKRLHIKDKVAQNAECYLFLSMMIKQQKSKYQYGYKFNGQRMKAQRILLPVNEEGKPNWVFVRNYIKSIPNARLIEND